MNAPISLLQFGSDVGVKTVDTLVFLHGKYYRPTEDFRASFFPYLYLECEQCTNGSWPHHKRYNIIIDHFTFTSLLDLYSPLKKESFLQLRGNFRGHWFSLDLLPFRKFGNKWLNFIKFEKRRSVNDEQYARFKHPSQISNLTLDPLFRLTLT